MKNNVETSYDHHSDGWLFSDNTGRKLEMFMYIVIGFGPSVAAMHALGQMAI
tara:strand:- start:36260 stop:36415 length:156 start_codon:yes stop_codon:yes gene_type:complete